MLEYEFTEKGLSTLKQMIEKPNIKQLKEQEEMMKRFTKKFEITPDGMRMEFTDDFFEFLETLNSEEYSTINSSNESINTFVTLSSSSEFSEHQKDIFGFKNQNFSLDITKSNDNYVNKGKHIINATQENNGSFSYEYSFKNKLALTKQNCNSIEDAA